MSVNLDPEEQAILIQFRERVSDVLHGLRTDFQRKDENLVKFLIGRFKISRVIEKDFNDHFENLARDYNADTAEEMLRKTMEWTQANNVNSILERPFCHDLDHYYELFLTGLDKIGHPHHASPRDDEDWAAIMLYLSVIFAQGGRWDLRGVLHPKAKTAASVIVTQFLEKLSDLCRMISKDGKMITKYYGVLDCAEFDYTYLANTKVITTGLNLVRENSQLLINYYPDCLHKFVVINAPPVFRILWAVIRPLLPRASLAKVSIYGTNSDKWKNYLLEHIDPDVLPSQYGGANTTGLFDCRLEVDKDFIPRTDLELLPPTQLLECYIEPRKSFSVDITTKPGEVIVWNFKTETCDIGFKVECDDGRIIVEQCKVDAHKFTQKGKLHCSSEAKYTFTWDNSYSYVTGKKLIYAVKSY